MTYNEAEELLNHWYSSDDLELYNSVLSHILDMRYCDVLRYRYQYRLPMKRIALLMGYDLRWVKRLRHAAVRAFAAAYDKLK